MDEFVSVLWLTNESMHQCDSEAIARAGDAVASMPTDDFLSRADAGCRPEVASGAQALSSPVIPHGCAYPPLPAGLPMPLCPLQ